MLHSNTKLRNATVMDDDKPQFLSAITTRVQQWQNLQYSVTEMYFLNTQTD